MKIEKEIKMKIEHTIKKICEKLSSSDSRFRIAKNEANTTTEYDHEAAEFLKFNGKRIGRDFKLYEFMANIAGVQASVADFAEVLVDVKSLAPMSSLEIAEITGKRHSDVLRDIDVMLKSLDADLRSGLKTTSYKDASGKSNRSFELDKDSSLCLMSGYDVNARMKIIKRWQELEKASQLPVSYKPVLPPETQLLVDQIYQIHELKQTQVVHTNQIALLLNERKHLTVGAWLVNRGYSLSTVELSSLGKRVASYCRDNDIAAGKCQQAQYKVNTYPIEVMEQLLGVLYPDRSEIAFSGVTHE